MSTVLKSSLLLQDLILSLKVAWTGAIGQTVSRRAALTRLLEVRVQRCGADNLSLSAVYEALAYCYLSGLGSLGGQVDSLHTADFMARKALAITVASNKGVLNTFRAAKVVHLLSIIQLRLNNPSEALILGEEALRLYCQTKPLCHERAALMQELLELYTQAGLFERAEKMRAEYKAISKMLSSVSARHRF
jgi:hypothetical protein